MTSISPVNMKCLLTVSIRTCLLQALSESSWYAASVSLQASMLILAKDLPQSVHSILSYPSPGVIAVHSVGQPSQI